MQNTHNLLVGTLSIFIPSLISSVLCYLTLMRLGLWQGSLRMQIFFCGTSQEKMKHVKFIFKKEIMN